MTTKQEFEPLYWATKEPDKRAMSVVRYQDVRNGAGVKGYKIGVLGIGAELIVDWNEQDEGWIRIVKVGDWKPVPATWISAQADTPEQEREWWVDKTAIIPVGLDVSVKRYLLTIDPVKGNSVVEV